MELFDGINTLLEIAWIPGTILWGLLYVIVTRKEKALKELEVEVYRMKELGEKAHDQAKEIVDKKPQRGAPQPIIVDIPQGVNPVEWIMENHERIIKESPMDGNAPQCDCEYCKTSRELGIDRDVVGQVGEAGFHLQSMSVDEVFDWCEKAEEGYIEMAMPILHSLGYGEQTKAMEGYLKNKSK